MTKLKLNPNFTYYFGIYVVKKDTDNSIQSNYLFYRLNINYLN